MAAQVVDDRVHSKRRIDVVDGVMLAALMLLASWIAAVLIWRAHRTGLVWTGTDGPFIGDQMQYLGWISDSADNGRIGNPFQLGPRAEGFVHPGLVISGLLHRFGLPTWVAYLVWKPVAVVALFFAARAYVRHLIEPRWARRVALALALFGMPAIAHGAWTVHLAPGAPIYLRVLDLETWPGLYLWGYPFTAIAVALLPLTLLAHERARAGDLPPWMPALLCFGCSWLQPWQGATAVGIVVLSELVWWRRSPGRPLVLGATVVAGALPLGYYAMLSKVDASWLLAGQVNRMPSPPWWIVLVAVAPIGVVALLELRRPLDTFGTLSLRLWPLVALSVYWMISQTGAGTFPPHSLQGMSIPLAVLALRGVTSFDRTRSGAGLIIVTTLVAVVYVLQPLWHELDRTAATGRPFASAWVQPQPYLIEPAERDALQYLRTVDGEGGVLSSIYLGQVVPAWTGRSTWVGIASWTPDFAGRVAAADQLFANGLGPNKARALVRSTGARFVLEDCRATADLSAALAPVAKDVAIFGCARVYDLGPPN